MEDNQDIGMSAFKGSETELNPRYMCSKTDGLFEWPPLSVESSFSYVATSTSKSPGSSQQQKRSKISTSPKHGVTNGIVQQRTVSTTETKGNNGLDKKRQEFNADLSLKGKRLQLWPEVWSLDYAKQTQSNGEVEGRNSESSEEFRFNSGLQTYPLSTRSVCTSAVDSACDNFSHPNRHRLPSFHPRPLGQSWVGNHTQRKKPSERAISLDNLRASGVRQPLCTRTRSHPPRYTISPHLRRSSSPDSLRGVPRTRSASLPVPSKLHESRMVMEWKEKRAGGVTYVTPCLQTLSDGDLSSYSQLKIEHETNHSTPKNMDEDDS